MPKVLLSYDIDQGEYSVYEAWDWEINSEYEVVVEMKSSHYRNIMRNLKRTMDDQEFLNRFFIQAQASGRAIRER